MAKPRHKFEIVGSNGRCFPINSLQEAKRLMKAASEPDEKGNIVKLRQPASMYGASDLILQPPFTLRNSPYIGKPFPLLPKPGNAAYKRKANLPPLLPFEEDLADA